MDAFPARKMSWIFHRYARFRCCGAMARCLPCPYAWAVRWDTAGVKPSFAFVYFRNNKERFMNSQTESMIKSVQSAAAALSAPLADVRDEVVSGARRARAQLIVGLDDAIKDLARSSKTRRAAVDRARRLGSQTSESLARHPFIAVGVIAGACYLLARRLWRRAKPIAAAPARKVRSAQPRRKRAAPSAAALAKAKAGKAGGNSQIR
jgi:ElaB/YqjD/DUF883 family membrane-anchored ribosome-binding protein